MIHIEPSKLFRSVKERVEFDDKERTHLDKCDYCREVLAVFENCIAEVAAEKSRGA